MVYHFSEYVFTHFYWRVQIFLRIPDSHKKEKGNSENMVDRTRAALELRSEDLKCREAAESPHGQRETGFVSVAGSN